MKEIISTVAFTIFILWWVSSFYPPHETRLDTNCTKVAMMHAIFNNPAFTLPSFETSCTVSDASVGF
jgi:hypothetical protein